MRKRIIINIFLVSLFLLTSVTGVPASAKTTSYFSDISQSDWSAAYISKLVDSGNISGYADGTFKPNKTITKAEFVTLLLRSLDYKQETTENGHWAMDYIRKAESLGILEKNEFNDADLDKPINRAEVAKVIINALDETYPENLNNYKLYINDFDNIHPNYQEYVLKAYGKGLLAGYSDGEFKGDKNLTRAEALAVIMRVIDKNERVILKEPVKPRAKEVIETASKEKDKRQLIVQTAMKYLGVPYRWGGANPSGFDSSGIIWYTFKENGIQLPRVSFDMYKVGRPISKEELLPGDLVFFEGYAPGPSHGVIYIGDGKFVHSPRTGKTVSIGRIDDPYYYAPRYYGARRVIE
ncbi:MAG: peptidoglycan DL-endopeptidase CwlO [Petroclostridium sp.]|jgi:hypothetical protein|uniref:S-layer homology domain-containing protein n=1 Tax=Petroclostridium xylanilyticum TaxID=1792311 RepID=UPI000B97FCBF|nr:S-layer homology domain-containing protein [Petroclostridium xylanilyticum]MDK2809469.1 peptidoglycan DL-endopeptidase CwlO [Petroclostridium sp.]